MALKKKITKAEFDALAVDVQKEYKADGDAYVLDLDDTAFETLKAEKAAEKAKREEAEQKLAAKEAAEAEAVRKAAEDAAKASGDIAALEASWKAKRDADVEAERQRNRSLTSVLESTYVDGVARTIATKISIVPDLLVDQIKKRLKLEVVDGVPLTRVLDAAGKPSAASVSDLEKEFLDNPAYKAVIKGSDARGGGASGGPGGGAPSKKLSEMTGLEEVAFAREHPAEYQRMISGQ